MVTPASIARGAQALLQHGFGRGELRLVLTPRTSSSVVSMATARKPIARAIATASVR